MDYNKAFNLPQSYYMNIKREQEIYNRSQIPDNAICPNCKVNIHNNLTNEYCDNSCSTRVCAKCYKELFFNNGEVLKGHDNLCGEEEEDEQ